MERRGDRGIAKTIVRHIVATVVVCSIPLSPRFSIPPLVAQISPADIISGQDLIYTGRFGAAQFYFSDLTRDHPREAAGPMLTASALIWWGEAEGNESFMADSIDVLLTEGIRRAQAALDAATADSARVASLFWLGSSYGYRARQAGLTGNNWRAAHDAKAMRVALERALALDSACADCLLGLGVYDYALARAGSLARLVARVIGLGGGDAARAFRRMAAASERGVLTRTEARWVYASALLREGERDRSLREDGLRRVAALVEQFPENPVFRRALPPLGTP